MMSQLNLAESCFTKVFPFFLSDEDVQKIEALLVPVPRLEVERIGTLRSSRLLDTPAEASYDRYTKLCARLFKTPTCLISLVDVNRQWFKSRVGLEATQTHRNCSFCAYTVHECSNDVFIVRFATQDPRFCENPLVTGSLNICFYAGAALIVQGQKIGSLCIIDTKPRPNFSTADAVCLREVALIVEQLIEERRQRFMQTESDLARMTVSILYTLRYPLQALHGKADELRNRLTNSVHLTNVDGVALFNSRKEVMERLKAFQVLVHRLEVSIQSNLELALAFSNLHTSSLCESFRINSYIHLLSYVQEQSAMPLKENVTNYSTQLLKMRDKFASHTLRMVEVIGKLQYSVGALDSFLCDRIAWRFAPTVDRSDKGVAKQSLHTAYLLNVHVLYLVLNSVLATHAFQHPNYSAAVSCNVAAVDEDNSRNNKGEQVCQFVLTASVIVANRGSVRGEAEDNSSASMLESYHDILGHIVRSAEGAFNYQVNQGERDGSHHTELIYSVSLPCIAFSNATDLIYPTSIRISGDNPAVIRRVSSESTGTSILCKDEEWGDCSLFSGNSTYVVAEDSLRPGEYTYDVVKAVAGKYWRSVFKNAHRRVVPQKS